MFYWPQMSNMAFEMSDDIKAGISSPVTYGYESHTDKSGQRLESVVKIKRKVLLFQSTTVREWGVRSVLMVSLGVGRTLLSKRDARQPSLCVLMTSLTKQETGEGKKGSVPLALD